MRSTCGVELSEIAARERFKVHRDTWVHERDFIYLAANGIELIRIPVPYFVFGDVPPYIGCIDYLDRAFEWARRHGQKVLIDLHTVPGGQNGFDNSGICGVCTFHKKPENVEFALTVLERLAARYREHPSLWGVQVLNEPISQEVWDIVDIPTRYPSVDPEEAAGSEPYQPSSSSSSTAMPTNASGPRRHVPRLFSMTASGSRSGRASLSRPTSRTSSSTRIST